MVSGIVIVMTALVAQAAKPAEKVQVKAERRPRPRPRS